MPVVVEEDLLAGAPNLQVEAEQDATVANMCTVQLQFPAGHLPVVHEETLFGSIAELHRQLFHSHVPLVVQFALNENGAYAVDNAPFLEVIQALASDIHKLALNAAVVEELADQQRSRIPIRPTDESPTL